jgi:hypothetical protein
MTVGVNQLTGYRATTWSAETIACENRCENQTFANRGKWRSMMVGGGRSRLMSGPDHGMKMSLLGTLGSSRIRGII